MTALRFISILQRMMFSLILMVTWRKVGGMHYLGEMLLGWRHGSRSMVGHHRGRRRIMFSVVFLRYWLPIIMSIQFGHLSPLSESFIHSSRGALPSLKHMIVLSTVLRTCLSHIQKTTQHMDEMKNAFRAEKQLTIRNSVM